MDGFDDLCGDDTDKQLEALEQQQHAAEKETDEDPGDDSAAGAEPEGEKGAASQAAAEAIIAEANAFGVDEPRSESRPVHETDEMESDEPPALESDAAGTTATPAGEGVLPTPPLSCPVVLAWC